MEKKVSNMHVIIIKYQKTGQGLEGSASGDNQIRYLKKIAGIIPIKIHGNLIPNFLVHLNGLSVKYPASGSLTIFQSANIKINHDVLKQIELEDYQE